jgi:hypothetical protein
MALPFAFDRLDLDDIGAEVAEPLRRERTSHRDGAIERAIAGENLVFLHGVESIGVGEDNGAADFGQR